jgi:hypothetical protein
VEQTQKLITPHLNPTAIPRISQGELHGTFPNIAAAYAAVMLGHEENCRVAFVPCFCAKLTIITHYNHYRQRKYETKLAEVSYFMTPSRKEWKGTSKIFSSWFLWH